MIFFILHPILLLFFSYYYCDCVIVSGHASRAHMPAAPPKPLTCTVLFADYKDILVVDKFPIIIAIDIETKNCNQML